MKSFQIAFLAAAALAASPAAAFTIQRGNGPTDDNSSRYADPDERLPQFANPNDRAPSTTRFGNSGFSFGLSGSRGEPGADQSAVPGSYEATHPSAMPLFDSRSRFR